MKLQDLPHDVLQRVMSPRLPLPSIARVPEIKRSATFRPVAVLHPALYRAYRNLFKNIIGIEATVPGLLGDYTFYGSISGNLQMQISFLANMIGPRLKVLKLPNLHPGVQRMLHSIIKHRCKEIEELHFFDSAPPMSPSFSTVIKALPRLEILKVHSPKAIFFGVLIENELFLRELYIVDLPKECFKHLRFVLKCVGKRLRRIAFLEQSLASPMINSTSFQSTLRQWSHQIQNWNPEMRHITISIPASCEPKLLMASMKLPSAVIEKFSRYCQFEVATAIERAIFPQTEHGLRQIDAILSLSVKTITSIALKSSAQGQFSYTHLYGDPEAVFVSLHDWTSLVSNYSSSKLTTEILSEVSPSVKGLVSKSSASPLNIRHYVWMLRYFAQMLTNISELHLCVGLIANCPDKAHVEFGLSKFKRLSALHLVIGNYEDGIFHLLHFLVRFLDLAEVIEEQFPKLETFTIQKYKRWDTSHQPVWIFRNSVKKAVKRLETLEERLPNLDASRVRAFLDFWWAYAYAS